MNGRRFTLRARFILKIAGVCFLVLTGRASEGMSLPVFPGAQGFGTETVAGRGGKLIRVTNLNDSGSGSLRSALAHPGARTVVFEIGGVIRLDSELIVSEPFLTLAGQSAPPPGITLRGAGLSIRSHDVLVQHIRIRVGDDPAGPPPSSRDGLNILGPDAHHVVIDHVSVSWAIDENLSTWFPVHDVTISNSIISEALHSQQHRKGRHSKGVLIGDHAHNVSLVRNLIGNNMDRHPLIKGDCSVVMVNNILFNPGTGKFIEMADDYDSGPSTLTAIGNIFVPGANTPPGASAVKVHKSSKPGTRVFFEGNQYPAQALVHGTAFEPRIASPSHNLPVLQPLPLLYLRNHLSLYSGARPRERDGVDLRIVEDLRAGGGRIIFSQEDVGGWPMIDSTHRLFTPPEHYRKDSDRDGYTDLEEYLHLLSGLIEVPQR